MADIPPEMMTRDRPADPEFADEEILFRRFRPEDFDGGEVALEAFELPDMSVNRKKHGPAEWLLLEEEFAGWGVAAFRVEDIPRDRELLHLGVIAYVLRPEHVPLKYNYPHAEVRVYRAEVRICRDNKNLHLLEPEFHIRWRERLSIASRVAISPKDSR
jgi:hypothetical protein